MFASSFNVCFEKCTSQSQSASLNVWSASSEIGIVRIAWDSWGKIGLSHAPQMNSLGVEYYGWKWKDVLRL